MIAATCSTQWSAVRGTIIIVAGLLTIGKATTHMRIDAGISRSTHVATRAARATTATDVSRRSTRAIGTFLLTRATRIDGATSRIHRDRCEQYESRKHAAEDSFEVHDLVPKMW